MVASEKNENISEVFSYRRLELRYFLADVSINDIKWTEHGR